MYIYMHIHLSTCVLRDVAANVAVQPLIARIALANSVSDAPSLVVALGSRVASLTKVVPVKVACADLVHTASKGTRRCRRGRE